MMSAWLMKGKTEAKPNTREEVKVKAEVNKSPSKTPTKRPSMMAAWLSKANPSPEKAKVKQGPQDMPDESHGNGKDDDPPNKRSKQE